jgi:hypothetical protein
VLEHDIHFVEEHPEMVVQKYVEAGYDLQTAQLVAGFYGKEGIYVQSNRGICLVEARLYQWKWYLPLGLLIPSTIYFGWLWLRKDTF